MNNELSQTRMGNRLSILLREERPLLGLYNGYPAEGILELIGTGWDFIWIDGQHGQFSIDSALRAVRTTSALGLESVLRAPSHDAGLLGQYADTGTSGVMVPQVETLTSATAIVEALRFPPNGKRSFGGRRAVDLHGRDYCLSCQPTVIVQIESCAGLDNSAGIAAIDGVDVLFLGMDDLKLSLGLDVNMPVQECEALKSARHAVAAAAGASGKSSGLAVANVLELREAVELGYGLICCGSDVGFLRAGSRLALEQHRSVVDELLPLNKSK
jgi:4-hydroxy-2-oxoheptanedioate aldolase